LHLEETGGAWNVVDGPNPGSGSDILGGIVRAGDTLWAAGVYDDGAGRLTFIERH
jgi:hypothetical protein